MAAESLPAGPEPATPEPGPAAVGTIRRMVTTFDGEIQLSISSTWPPGFGAWMILPLPA